jgi:hypothetical protein
MPRRNWGWGLFFEKTEHWVGLWCHRIL